MSTGYAPGECFEQLMSINRSAFSAGKLEVAYHALMAALHCAQDLNDVAKLGDVERTATGQRDWIDAHAPGHRLSTQSAKERGHDSIFAVTARQAAAHVLMAHHQKRPVP